MRTVPILKEKYRAALAMRERLRNLFRWRPTSPEELDQAEARILSHLKCPYKTYYVDIGKGWNLEHVLLNTLEVPPKFMLPGDEASSASARSRANSLPQQRGVEDQFVPPHLQGLPLVLVHGFASGVALWSLNLDELSLQGKRHIFAFDLLGFAKSSRPKWSFPSFSKLTSLQKSKAEAEAMETYLVDSVEKWRRAIGAPLGEKFILLGHSFGGYLAAAYALKYPEHVAHLILADPWGFSADSHTKSPGTSHYTSSRQLPVWVQFLGRVFLDLLTPLAGLRAAGPWGPLMINSLRPDLTKKFAKLKAGGDGTDAAIEADISSEASDTESSTERATPAPPADDMITAYIYHCNASSPPSGEIAFKKLCTHTGWARMPMVERIIQLAPHITLSFIYGSRSWIDRQSGFQTKYILATAANSHRAAALPATSSSDSDADTSEAERVNVHIMQGSGHHVYADNSEEFNSLVLNISTEVDCVLLQQAMEEQGNDFEWEEDDSFLQQQIGGDAEEDATDELDTWLENGDTPGQIPQINVIPATGGGSSTGKPEVILEEE